MKFHGLLALAVALQFSALPRGFAATRIAEVRPFGQHLELEMTGPEYSALFAKLNQQNLIQPKAGDPVQDLLVVGKRNLDWLTMINAARPADRQLELTTADSTVAVPITDPRLSNRGIIIAIRDSLRAALPAAMVDVLFNGAPMTANLPGDADAYLRATRKVDSLYQQASRWLLQEPYLWQYTMMVRNDIRGYFFLSQEADLEQKLKGWSKLSQTDRDRLQPWLVGECRNSGSSLSSCRAEFIQSVSRPEGSWAYHSKYLVEAHELYQSFFAVSNARSDIAWSGAHPDELVLPFRQPASAEVQKWLSDNIQDEWRLGSWQLSLSFRATGPNMVHILFAPGATAHVDGLGGNEITMDSNRQLQEYLMRWTIRHEFGHTLGFPDCYVEYYDDVAQVMINYQIDIANLMCSRRGHILPTHYDELKKNYFKP